MAKATQTTTKKTTVTIKPKTSNTKTSNGTGRKRCPSCGKYM